MKGGLSDSQRKLIEWLEQNDHWFVTTDEIASLLSCSHKEAHSIGFALSLKKWFTTLGCGQYFLLKSIQKKQPPTIHPLVIGSRLIDPYYFSFQTATAYHGLTQPTPQQVYIITTNIRNSADIRDVSYRFVHVTPRKFFGYSPVSIEGSNVQMADKEKTFVDCLEKFKHCGGIVEVVRLLKDNLQNLDIQRLVDYTVLMGSSTLIQRLGYVLNNLDVTFDEEFLQSYSLGVLTYFDPNNSYNLKPKRNEKWNLMVNIPDSLFEKEI
jgi:predicted transcriptional regulator of viral defense system